jgi:hypothetical protein
MGERVQSLLLEVGDVIHVCHDHDLECCDCLGYWEIYAVVTEKPALVDGRIAVKWAKARLRDAGRTITGINLLRPEGQVLRIGRLPVRQSGPHHVLVG